MTALLRAVTCGLTILFTSGIALAQERPYFVTYDDQLEQRGELELELLSTTGKVKDEGTRYVAPWLELEYGVTKWWTAELYLESATFGGDGSAFTGWRVESRFRPIKGEHVINPVLYVEYEDINEASRIQKEIVGRGPLPFEPISTLKEERARELEGRLILSSWFRKWNVSENLVVEKNLSEDEGVEFGYAVGVARSFGEAGTWECRFCAGALTASLEVYGGLGTTAAGASGATRQFIAPVIAWHVTGSSMFKASAAFGMTSTSDRLVLRVAYTFDLELW
jgi:hypothetical protein